MKSGRLSDVGQFIFIANLFSSISFILCENYNTDCQGIVFIVDFYNFYIFKIHQKLPMPCNCITTIHRERSHWHIN